MAKETNRNKTENNAKRKSFANKKIREIIENEQFK